MGYSHLLVLSINLLAHFSQCSEWMTSGENHCIERCSVSTRVLGDLTLSNVLTCPVVDGVNVEYRPPGSGRPSSDGEENEMQDYEKYQWDYCTPAETEALGKEDEPELGTMKPAPLPDTGSGFNPGSNTGGGGYNSGAGFTIKSSLYGVDCTGECRRLMNGPQHKCTIPGQHLGLNSETNFFCSPSANIPRERLTSRNKLWCIGPCMRNGGKQNFECRTLFGTDICSPQSGVTVKSTPCYGSCTEDPNDENGHYKCFIDQFRNKMEHCGPMANEVPQAVTHAVEYSNEGKVCAGPCEDRDGDPMCHVVYWEYDEERKVSDLQMGLEYCGVVNNQLRDIGIIIGCIVAAIAIIALVAFVVARKKYNRVNTNE